MVSIRTLFDTLLARDIGTKVELGVADRNDYETLRTRLVKFWTDHKEIITAISDDDPSLEYGMCGDYKAENGTAQFWIGKPRRKVARHYSFTIVEATEQSATDSPDSASSQEEQQVSVEDAINSRQS